METWLGRSPLFYPAWEILPHEGKLPHADVISDRLQTLVALSGRSTSNQKQSTAVVTSVTALLQKTFAPDGLKSRTRPLNRGDKIAPLDLIEWLEAQGYEPEAQVTQRGEIALRGGIVDIYPPTSPWPVRVEFFGDDLESLRYFDPLTQISREEIPGITLPPAGELGILRSAGGPSASASTLLDHLPRETIFLLCDPETLAVHAETYARQIPAKDAFFISWPDFLIDLNRHGLTSIELFDDGTNGVPGTTPASPASDDALHFTTLDAFRPLAERAPEPQIAEMQRREFFRQLHRWLRQEYAVHVFCNNDGERQRFEEILKDLNLADDNQPNIQIGSLARGFICEAAKLVVVTDAEIFGRYKVLRPRRLK
ncbi:MAG: transcription-repair coupling factor, partial [Verrucomicrobia bacterium]|nr:transcription-repair coupling factor [Verrucomicrobiota bacterium]